MRLRKKTRAGECEEEKDDRSIRGLVSHSNRACPNQPPRPLYTRKPLNQRQVLESRDMIALGATEPGAVSGQRNATTVNQAYA